MRIVNISNNQTWHEKLNQLRAIQAATGGRLRYHTSTPVFEQYFLEELSDMEPAPPEDGRVRAFSG